MTSLPNTLRAAAVSLGVLTISVAVAGWMVLGGIQRLDDVGVTSVETFETLRRTVEVTSSTTATVADALSDLEVLVETIARSAEKTADFVGDAAEVTSTRIPRSLGAIERAMPGLIDAAAVIDDSLAALSILGVDYQPDTPFDDALREIQASLDGLADEVADQGSTLEQLVPEVQEVGVTASGLTSRVRDTRDHLRAAETVLGDYRMLLDSTERAIGSDPASVWHGWWGWAVLVLIGFAGLALSVVTWRMAAQIEAEHDV